MYIHSSGSLTLYKKNAISLCVAIPKGEVGGTGLTGQFSLPSPILFDNLNNFIILILHCTCIEMCFGKYAENRTSRYWKIKILQFKFSLGSFKINTECHRKMSTVRGLIPKTIRFQCITMPLIISSFIHNEMFVIWNVSVVQYIPRWIPWKFKFTSFGNYAKWPVLGFMIPNIYAFGAV